MVPCLTLPCPALLSSGDLEPQKLRLKSTKGYVPLSSVSPYAPADSTCPTFLLSALLSDAGLRHVTVSAVKASNLSTSYS